MEAAWHDKPSAAPTHRCGVALQIQQRDNEINILVAMLKKRGGAAPDKLAAASPPPACASSDAAVLPVPAADSLLSHAASTAHPPPAATPAPLPKSHTITDSQAALLDGKVLKDRAAAFELFRKSYKRNAAIEDNKAVRLSSMSVLQHFMTERASAQDGPHTVATRACMQWAR